MKGSTAVMKEAENWLMKEPGPQAEASQPLQRDRPTQKARTGKNIELLGPIILIILLMIVSSLFIGVF